MTGRSEDQGFLEKTLGSLPGEAQPHAVRWVGDPVRVHLSLLLNSRRGSVEHLPDYGLPDVSSFYSEYPASLGQLRSLVEQLIKKYEPRLANVRVRLLETNVKEFRASFLIAGDVEVLGERVAVQYRTTITSSGRAALGSSGDE